jgi:hypothetical protein
MKLSSYSELLSQAMIDGVDDNFDDYMDSDLLASYFQEDNKLADISWFPNRRPQPHLSQVSSANYNNGNN